MKKPKRTLVSLIVFLTVFCLSAIFNIQSPYYKIKEEITEAKKNLKSSTEVVQVDTNDMKVHSFSYKMNAITIWDDTDPIIDDNPVNEADTTVAQADIALSSTGAASSEAAETDEVQQQAPSKTRAAETGEVQQQALSITEAAETGEVQQQALSITEAAETGSTEALAVEKPEPLYSNIAISVAKDYVNIRKEASTDSGVLGKLYRGSAAEIIEKEGDWYLVESGSVKGYVMAEYLKTGISDDELVEKYGTQSIVVKADGLNVRKDPSIEAKKLTVIYQNETYPVLEQQEEWIKINITDDNVSGYVKQEFAELIVDFKDAVSKEEEEELLRIQAEERAKKETEVKYRDEVSYSAEDLKLLACLVHAEAGTQSYEGKLAVANIVLNRVKSSKYPDSIKAVIYQSGQFSVAHSGSLDKQLANYDNYNSKSQLLSLKAATAALEGANNIGSRLYFHTYRAAVKKGYDEKSTCVKIEDHLFW